MKMKRTFNIATGGICAAVCAVMLIISAGISFGQYTAAVLAGLILHIMSYKTGTGTALCSYVAASVAAFVFSADRSGLFLFIILTGYYPVLRSLICVRMGKKTAIIIIIKLLFSCITGTLYVMTFFFVLNIRPAFVLFEDKILAAVMIISYIVLFFIYDTALYLFEKSYKLKIISFLDRIIR